MNDAFNELTKEEYAELISIFSDLTWKIIELESETEELKKEVEDWKSTAACETEGMESWRRHCENAEKKLKRLQENIDITESALGMSGIYAKLDERAEKLEKKLNRIETWLAGALKNGIISRGVYANLLGIDRVDIDDYMKGINDES